MRLLKDWQKQWAVEAARQVISELNGPRTLQNEAVERLSEMLTALQELRRKEARGESIHPDELKPVNEYLARHRWIAQLVVTSDPALYFQHQEVLEPTDIPGAVEQRLASAVVALASDGTLEHIQRCDECSAWFYGRRRLSGQSFCGESCRKKNWRKENKQHLSAYQKNYYREVLSPVTSRAVRRRKRR